MQVQYFEPLSRAWNYMIDSLFRPFDIGKWFVLGFSAFLANLLEGPGTTGSFNWKHDSLVDLQYMRDIPYFLRDWIVEHPDIVTLVIAGIVVAITLVVLLTWLSSRGKFMFLDNVVHDRALVSQPWYEFKKEGDSLFVWRLIFGLISLLVIALWLTTLVFIMVNSQGESIVPNISFGIFMFLTFLFIILAILYIATFLTDFIVPIMYKNRISATEAWKEFLNLFSQYWGYFIFYGIVKLFLFLLVATGVVLVGFFTCCFGFLLLAIPYIGSIVMLPISFTFRSFSVMFLEQFDAKFQLFGQESTPVLSED